MNMLFKQLDRLKISLDGKELGEPAWLLHLLPYFILEYDPILFYLIAKIKRFCLERSCLIYFDPELLNRSDECLLIWIVNFESEHCWSPIYS